MLFFNAFFKTLGFLLAIIVFVLFINIILSLASNNKVDDFEYVEGEKSSNNIISVLNLNGPIINRPLTLIQSDLYNFIDPLVIRNKLEKLKEIDPKIILIKINSPGGSVSASVELERVIFDFIKTNNHIKLYFYTDDILASGGYWVATSGNKIFAKYGSIIGSIGVSGPAWYYYNKPKAISTGILGQSIETQNGIEVFTQSAGKSKDLFNPFRKPSNKEVAHLQSIVENIYEKFINKVSKNRKIEKSTLKNNIGALIYGSVEAKKNFLIDDVIDYQGLIKKIVTEENFDDYKIIEDKYKFNIFQKYFAKDNQNFNKLICNRLNTSFISIVPTFFKNC